MVDLQTKRKNIKFHKEFVGNDAADKAVKEAIKMTGTTTLRLSYTNYLSAIRKAGNS